MKAIDEEILKELSAGRMAGPFNLREIESLFPYFKTSMLAAVPKADTDEMRIIDDLTHGDQSVNQWISDEEATVRYSRFDKALHLIRRLGRGCWLAKIDWRSAFRQIGVCRNDWPLLGIHWRNQLFVRLVLPFGARSSPERFTRFSKAFAGILRSKGADQVVDYLDDFLLVGSTEEECRRRMILMETVATELGVELHPTKRDGPSTVLTFLGIGIDTINMKIFLPLSKKNKLRSKCIEVLRSCVTGVGVSLRTMQSLIGLMFHAAQVVQPGRFMTRRILEEMRAMDKKDRQSHRNAIKMYSSR